MMLPYCTRRSLHVLVRKGGFIRIRTDNLTDICRCGHRPDIAFVESLLLKLDNAIEIRRSNGSVATIGLVATISPRVEAGFQGKLTD